MRYVYLPIPVPSVVPSLGDVVRAFRTVWTSRRGDESPRPIELERLKVEAVFRHDFAQNLTQPGIDPEALVSEGLERFADIRGRVPVATSFRSNSSLTKVISPPQCKLTQVSKIAAYEARNQIPFDLTEVEWRHLFAGEQELDGEYLVRGDIILAAVKNTVLKSVNERLGPIRKGVDLVTSEALIAADVARSITTPGTESATALLEMHTEYSGLTVVTRSSVWHRDIPIGGCHFTRAVGQELKLVYEKAEHLKKNATQADDPKLVFLCMRALFQDLVQEISRSLLFWKSLHVGTEIDTLRLSGGPSNLPGIRPFLAKHLGISVEEIADAELEIDGIKREEMSEFLTPTFLAAQRLGFGVFRTNFLPRSRGFGLGSKSAWGINIGQSGIFAAKVALKS